MTNLLSATKNTITTLIGKINWPPKPTQILTDGEFKSLREQLKDNYFIILTRHDGHLSTYAIAFAHWWLTGRFGYYAHALMNLEDEVTQDSDFRFIEATGKGVHYSNFNEAIDNKTSSVVLLKPKSMTIDQWTTVMDQAKTNLGKPYDTLFELADDRALSCVELVRTALRAEPNYEIDFANFEKMITDAKNLSPQMFYECPDFEIVWESRH